MHSQKVDFALSVSILGALKMFPAFGGTKTRYKALKQLAFLNAEHLKRFSPKMLNLVHKTLFTSLSRLFAALFAALRVDYSFPVLG